MGNVTSEQWWDRIKKNKVERDSWLKKQVFGEFQAHKRILDLSIKFNNPTLKVIAGQELNHANWLKEYCDNNYVDLTGLEEHKERYWNKVNLNFETLEDACAVGAHAEKMRLDRIRVIANDSTSLPVLSDVFKKILKDEIFHETAFRELSGDKYESARANHEAGAEALGLAI